MGRSRILLFSNWFAPGYRGGGSQLATINLVHALRNEYEFWVVTRDRDVGAVLPFEKINRGGWTSVDGVQVRYLSPGELSFLSIAKLVRETPHELLHLNSVVSLPFGTFPLLAARFTGSEILVSPHGEMAAAALSKKWIRKGLYLRGMRAAGAFRATWHAASEAEMRDIKAAWGASANVEISPPLPSAILQEGIIPRPPKVAGKLKAVFLARIDRMKNLEHVIDLVSRTHNVSLDIYGPIGQSDYWANCQQKIATSPRPSAFRYCGSVVPERVISTLSEYDLLVQPSQNENFGYTILEAFVAGCPVLISDRTPWRELEARGIGFDVPLGNHELFRQKLALLRDLDESTYSAMRARTALFARDYITNSPAKATMRSIYESLISRRP